MKFKLEIELGNDAMKDSNDVGEALLSVRTRLSGYPNAFDYGFDEGEIKDANGNAIGKWEVVDETAGN